MILHDIARLRSWTVQGAGPDGLAPPAPLSPMDEDESSENFPSSVLREGNVFTVGFDDVATFSVCFDTRSIALIERGIETTPDCISHLIYDHLAPRILAHDGHLVLHGAAVEIDGELAVFVGETGAGKSTLSASLHRAGHRLLGDDAVIVTSQSGHFFGEPVYPSLRLYPEAVSALLDDAIALSPMAYYSDKQRVTLAGLSQSPTRPIPLSTVFFLAGDRDAAHAAARGMAPAEACIGLVNQSFLLDPGDATIAAARLGEIARLEQHIRTFALEYPHDFARLPEVHALILQCMAQDGAHHERKSRA